MGYKYFVVYEIKWLKVVSKHILRSLKNVVRVDDFETIGLAPNEYNIFKAMVAIQAMNSKALN